MSEVKFEEVLKEAVTKSGELMKAYRAFHNYSFGNMLLAWSQCDARGLKVGPLATFKQWESKGRKIKKGSKAIELCMPVIVKREKENKETGETEEHAFKRFIFKRNWFVLDQTEGDNFEPEPLKDWNKENALKALEVKEIPFTMSDGNVQGYATREREVAINPLAQLPHKTLFHELGHIVLGHTEESLHDDERTPRNLREVEAESVALLCLAALDLDGQKFCRGYIQSWLDTETIPEKSAQKIIGAADKILKAGRA